MDDLSVIVQSLIDSELDDMILDLVYEIHSSLKGFPQQLLQINPTNLIEKQTCICPNCGQNNLLAAKFAYHLAKCLGAGRQSSRRAQRRIMVLTSSDENHFSKDIETNSISEDGSSCTGNERLSLDWKKEFGFEDSTSSSMTLISSNKTNVNEDEDYVDDFDNDEEDDWKPKKKKRRIPPKKTSIKRKKKLVVVVSPSNSSLNFPNCLIPIRSPVTKHVVIPLVPLPVKSLTSNNDEKIFFKTQSIPSESSNNRVHSPLNLVDDEQSSIIIFQEDRIN